MHQTGTKYCGGCDRIRSRSDFYAKSESKDGVQTRCKDCQLDSTRRRRMQDGVKDRRNEWQRAYYQTKQGRKNLDIGKARYIQKYPDRDNARLAARRAVRNGKLTKLPCSVCGTTIKVQGHHPDYSKPLEVIWLCSKHHAEIHATDPTLNPIGHPRRASDSS